MKSVPLTQFMRDKISAAMILHRFKDEVEALAAERAALADQIYRDLYKAADRARMDDLPKGWMPEAESLSVQFGDERGSYDVIQFNGRMGYGCWSQFRDDKIRPLRRRVADQHKSCCAKIYDPGHKRVAQWRAIKDRENHLEAQIKDVARQIKATLASIRTTFGLTQQWPESAPFLAIFEKKVVALPALPIADLNSKLGLPVEGEAA